MIEDTNSIHYHEIGERHENALKFLTGLKSRAIYQEAAYSSTSERNIKDFIQRLPDEYTPLISLSDFGLFTVMLNKSGSVNMIATFLDNNNVRYYIKCNGGEINGEEPYEHFSMLGKM